MRPHPEQLASYGRVVFAVMGLLYASCGGRVEPTDSRPPSSDAVALGTDTAIESGSPDSAAGTDAAERPLTCEEPYVCPDPGIMSRVPCGCGDYGMIGFFEMEVFETLIEPLLAAEPADWGCSSEPRMFGCAYIAGPQILCHAYPMMVFEKTQITEELYELLCDLAAMQVACLICGGDTI